MGRVVKMMRDTEFCVPQAYAILNLKTNAENLT
jgi:hypothetical protein